MRLFMRTVSLLIIGCTVFQSCEAAIMFSLESTVNSITLTWTTENGHGYSDFTITLDGTQQGGVHPGSEFNTGSSKTSEVITGLDSGTQYTVAVMSGTDEIWSGSIYTIPAAVISFTEASSSLNSVTLTWSHGSGSRNTYTISWGNTVSEKMQNIDGTDVSKVITGLIPQEGYTFSIVAVSGTKESSPVTVDVTLPDLPMVQNFVVDNGGIEVNSVKLTWTALSIPEDIKYTLTRTGSASTVTLNKDIEMHTFDSLTAGQEYTFTIAVSLDSVTGPQESVTTYTKPTTPSNLETANVGTTTLTLSWTASACQGATQTFTVRDADDTIPTGGNSVSVSSASLTELTPGKSYTFTVIATCGGQTGDTGSGKTESLIPSQVKNLKANQDLDDPDSITLIWVEGEGQRSHFSLTYSAPASVTPVMTEELSYNFTDILTPGTQDTFNVVSISESENSSTPKNLVVDLLPAKVTTFTRASTTLNTVTLSWNHGSGERDSYTISWGVNEKEENIPSTDTSRTITGLTLGETYTFSIVAVSNNKDSAAVTEVVTLSALPTVDNFAVSSVTETSVTLTWTAVDTDENIKYELSYPSTTATKDKDSTTLSFTGLSAGTEYTFSIVVVLDGVKGSPETVTDNTEPATPVGVTVEPESTTEVKVGWTENSKYTYTVTYKKKGSTGGPITTPCVTTGCVTNVSLAGAPGTEITVYVTATLGTRTSNTATAEGHTVPPAPGQISVSTRTTTTLVVTWLDGAAGVFDKYEVSVIDTSTSSAPDGLGTMEIDDEAVKTAALSPLIPGRVYTVNVVTVKGTTPSEPATGLFRPNPEKATGLELDSRTTNSLTVKWNQPGEGDFTKYVVSLSGISGSEQKVNSKTHTFTDLIGGTQYTASVRVQSGEDDDTATATTAAKTISEAITLDVYTKPNAPTLNEPSATEDSVTVTWTAPAGDLTGYKLRLYSSDNSPVSDEKTVLKDGEKTLEFGSADNVKSGTIYTVKIFAYIDDIGNDIKSKEMSKQATTEPKPPTGLNTANTDTSSTRVSWIKPSQTADVDGYEVKLDFEGDVKTADVTSTAKDFTGLKAGATYSIEIKAYKLDHNNERSYSPALTGSVTLIPKKPTSVQVLEANKAQTRLGVTWSAPSDSEYTGFIVYWKLEGSSDVLESSDEIPVAQTYKYDISDLDIGETYYIEVKTKSGDKISAAGTTTSTTIPDGTSVNIISRGTDFISVSWPAPITDFDKFELQISSSDHAGFVPKEETVQKSSDYSKTYSDLKPGRTYTISIVVVSGDSRTISDIKAKTQPSKVMSLAATTLDMNRIQLTWNVDISSKQDKFSINHKDANNADKVKLVDYTEDTSSAEAIVENLLPGYHYTFNVLARREETNAETVDGESTEVTKNTVPAAVTSLQSSRTQTSVTLTWETDTNTFQDSFRVRYKGTATSTSWSSPEDVQEKEKMYEGLLPGDKYQFEVWARSGTEDSTKESVTVVLVPNSPTPVWNKDEASTTAVTFSWSYSENAAYHAEEFELVLREKGSAEIKRGPVAVTASTSTYTFQGLTAGQTYTVTLTTITYEGVKSEPKETDGTVGPSQVTSLLATTLDMSRIQLSWTVDTGSKQDQFNISYKDANGMDKVKWVNYTEGESSVQVIIENLLPGYRYTFSVLARLEETNFGLLDGESVKVTQNTVPAAVISLQSSQTQTSVTLTWETDTNTFQDSFRVRYKGTATLTSWSSPEDVQEKEKMYERLLSGDKYQFEVWARSGTEDSTKQSITVVLEPIAPTPVWNKDEASTTALTFAWSYDENIEYHAEGFQLELREKGSTDIVRGPVTVTTSTSAHTFQGLVAGQTYTFQISTVTYDDVRSDPKEADGTVGNTEVQPNNSLYIAVGCAVGGIVVIILIVIGAVLLFKRRRLSSAAKDNVDQKSSVRDVMPELESATDYNDINLYNELEIPQYEALSPKDKDQNDYDQLQVSTFTGSADATCNNMSEGVYCNEAEVANIKPEEEGKVDYLNVY